MGRFSALALILAAAELPAPAAAVKSPEEICVSGSLSFVEGNTWDEEMTCFDAAYDGVFDSINCFENVDLAKLAASTCCSDGFSLCDFVINPCTNAEQFNPSALFYEACEMTGTYASTETALCTTECTNTGFSFDEIEINGDDTCKCMGMAQSDCDAVSDSTGDYPTCAEVQPFLGNLYTYDDAAAVCASSEPADFPAGYMLWLAGANCCTDGLGVCTNPGYAAPACALTCTACPDSAETAAAASAKGGCASRCSAADLYTYCNGCAEGDADNLAECYAGTGGACFAGTSTVSALKEGGASGTEPVALVDLAPGRRVLAATAEGHKTFATVAAVARSAPVEDYYRIAMKNELGGEPKHFLKATPHHTFKTCGKLRAAVASTEAGSLQAGDCLHTVDGQAVVESVQRVAPSAGDETYTVVLEEGSGAEMLAVGGIFTHAKEAMGLKEAMADAFASGNAQMAKMTKMAKKALAHHH